MSVRQGLGSNDVCIGIELLIILSTFKLMTKIGHQQLNKFKLTRATNIYVI
jgi:hypothetical protein